MSSALLSKAKLLLLSGLSIFAPIQSILATTLALILADLIAGVLAARKRKETITSAGLRRTIAKILVYEAAIMLGFITQTYLTGDSIPIVKVAASLIGLTELLSCLENLNDLSDNKILASLIAKLGSQNEKK